MIRIYLYLFTVTEHKTYHKEHICINIYIINENYKLNF